MKQFFIFLSATLLAVTGISISIAAREPSSISNVAPSRTVPLAAYMGFDRDVYPGDAAFSTLRKIFQFTGYWLSPPPAEKATTWIGKRDFLRNSGFGFLVLFRGRLSHEFKKGSDGPEKGSLDAAAAAAASKKKVSPQEQSFFSISKREAASPRPITPIFMPGSTN